MLSAFFIECQIKKPGAPFGQMESSDRIKMLDSIVLEQFTYPYGCILLWRLELLKNTLSKV